jgi:hypothetical protein
MQPATQIFMSLYLLLNKMSDDLLRREGDRGRLVVFTLPGSQHGM